MKKIVLFLFIVAALKVEAQTSTFAVSDSLFAIGRYKMALLTLDKMEASFLSNVKKANIYEAIDNFKKASEYYELALTFKEDYSTKLKLAKNYRSLKQSKKAILIYEEILEKDSLNLVLKYKLGKLYIINKKPEKAITCFKYLIENDKTNANYSYYLALSYALNGKRDPMINSLLDTYKKDSLHLKAIARLANSFNKLKDVDSTQLFTGKGLAINKNHIELNKLKVNQLYKDKNYKEAIPLLLNLDTIDRKDTYSKSMLGRMYFKLDSLDKAKKYFNKLYAMDRENFKAKTYLGHIAMIEEDYTTATFNYMMATYVGKEKRDEEYFGLGNVFLKKSQPKQALSAYEEAFKENRRNYKVLYQWAKLSDDYYKDKKIAYKLYIKYIETFYEKDLVIDAFVKRRIKDIKKEYFIKGETLK